jgi:hypothetical protein
MSRRYVRTLGLASFVVAAVSLSACGDSGTGPSEDPDFATLSPQVAQDWCVRGTMSLGHSVSEVLSATDCPVEQSEALDVTVGTGVPGVRFETWRMKVTGQSNVKIVVSSNFDTVLDIYRVPDLGDPTSAYWLAVNDDDGPGNNARLILSLAPSYEYWVMLSGYDGAELGAYSIQVARP